MGLAKILVIDDEPVICRSICSALVIDEHEALSATDGEVGLQMCHEHRPDVVITDIMMPGKTGLDVIRELRETRQNIGIIAITGLIHSTLSELKQLGVDEVFRKPLRLRQLMSTVNRLLEQNGVS